MLRDRYPSKLLEDAVEAIGTLPGVGKRSAMRLALHLLRQPSENVHHLADALVHLRDDVKYCSTCMMISDADTCSICADGRRDHRTICVVETVRDVMSIEATGQYNGVYHVLGGSISPIDGIGPSDLTISALVSRVELLCDSDPSASLRVTESVISSSSSVISSSSSVISSEVEKSPSLEVILALGGDVEGETTAFYIYRQLSRFPVKLTTLARGLGFGDDLEYADEVTLGRSLAARQPFKP
ncbi:MAG: recombination protein RecR [Bacteroidales bacterium]|nr:recombination protein RecR [Bacteroidales bacterium]